MMMPALKSHVGRSRSLRNACASLQWNASLLTSTELSWRVIAGPVSTVVNAMWTPSVVVAEYQVEQATVWPTSRRPVARSIRHAWFVSTSESVSQQTCVAVNSRLTARQVYSTVPEPFEGPQAVAGPEEEALAGEVAHGEPQRRGIERVPLHGVDVADAAGRELVRDVRSAEPGRDAPDADGTAVRIEEVLAEVDEPRLVLADPAVEHAVALNPGRAPGRAFPRRAS